MRHDFLFETGRFNLTVAGAHFINPECFGEDLAAWLGDRLRESGVAAGQPDQEDWGWYLDATYRGRAYLVGIGASLDPDDTTPRTSNQGEWRVIVEPARSAGERVREMLGGAPAAREAAEFAAVVRRILDAEPDFVAVREDAES